MGAIHLCENNNITISDFSEDREFETFRIYRAIESDANGLVFDASAFVTPNGDIAFFDDKAVAKYEGEGVFQCRYNLDVSHVGNGMGAVLALRGWSNLSYVAVGYITNESFRHIKIPNAPQEKWFSIAFGPSDLINRIQDNAIDSSEEITALQIFVKGDKGVGPASIEIRSLASWSESVVKPRWQLEWDDKDSKRYITDLIYRYLSKGFKNYSEQALEFIETGTCPMDGEKNIGWDFDSRIPLDLATVNTYRFSWHAFHPVQILLLEANRTGEKKYLFAARDFVQQWLDASYYNEDKDRKYAWYDHGAADRLITLLLMWDIGKREAFDFRFMSRLRTVIFRHGQLMYTEAFYASHQLNRYHNHAWFQDIALMSTALMVPEFPCSKLWFDTAEARLKDQLDKLIVRDDGLAVFVENSIDYHNGVQRIAKFAGALIAGSKGAGNTISKVADELMSFSNYFKYPGGGSISQGDSFRRPHFYEREVAGSKAVEDTAFRVLADAGYAIVKGNHDNLAYMLTFLATSLNATHKHEDNLSFTLFFDGIEWLIDPSFYSHEYNQPIPAYLRSAAAHNNVCLPERLYSIEPGKASIKGRLIGVDEFSLSGNHSCYQSVVVKRKIVGSLSELLFSFNEKVLVDGSNEVKSWPECAYLMFQCGEGVTAAVTGDDVVLSHESSRYSVCLAFDTDSTVKIERGSITEGKIRGITGHGFMEYTEIDTVEVEMPIGSDFKWRMFVEPK